MKHVNYSMKTSHILCHYSEIGLKGKNRSYFENTLKRNIHDALNVTVPNAIDTIEKLRGRFLITYQKLTLILLIQFYQPWKTGLVLLILLLLSKSILNWIQ